MDLDNIECVSSSDGIDEDEIQHHSLHHSHSHHHSEFSSAKPRNGGANNKNVMGPATIACATSVHQLLECPVCTNSMYPPIHQVKVLAVIYTLIIYFFIYFWSYCGGGGEKVVVFVFLCPL